MTARKEADAAAWRMIREESPGPVVALSRRPPMVPVQAGIVDQLRDAYDDLMAAPEGQRGECRDGVVAVVAALLDEAKEQR